MNKAVHQAAGSVDDLVKIPPADPTSVIESYRYTTDSLGRLKEEVGTYESDHLSKDFTRFREMLSNLNGLIGDIKSKENAPVHYQSKDILSSPYAVKLGQCLQSYAENQEAVKGEIAAASEREAGRFEALKKEWAKEREERGWLEALTGILEVVGGVFVCVGSAALAGATFGLATPLAVAGMTAGGLMVINGASNMWEGMEDIHYGRVGDPFTVAFNPLRDTLFAAAFGEEGKQKAWETFGISCAVVGTVCTLGASGWSAWAKGGARAVGKFAVQAGVTMAAGAGGGMLGKGVAQWMGASDTVSDIVGLLTGTGAAVATGVKMQKWATKTVNEGAGGAKVPISDGKLNVNDIEGLKKTFSGKSPKEIADILRKQGYDVTVVESSRSRSGAKIIKINNPGTGKNISQVQVSPGGGRHGELPYVKISTTDAGKIKVIDGSKGSYKTDGVEKAKNIFTKGD